MKLRKPAIIGAIVGLVAGIGGTAAAYYILEATGTGTGTVAVTGPSSSSGAVTLQLCGQTAVPADCTSALPIAAVSSGNSSTVAVLVTNTASEQTLLTAVTLAVSSITNGDSNSSYPACSPSWFTITQPTLTPTTLAAAGSAGDNILLSSGQGAGTLSMPSDSNDVQNNCVGAIINITATAS